MEFLIELIDLLPIGFLVGRGFGMKRTDRSLNLIRPGFALRQSCLQQRNSLRNTISVPQTTVLDFQRSQAIYVESSSG